MSQYEQFKHVTKLIVKKYLDDKKLYVKRTKEATLLHSPAAWKQTYQTRKCTMMGGKKVSNPDMNC